MVTSVYKSTVSKPCVAGEHSHRQTCDDLLLVTLKCDLAMVCFTTFGVTVLIFHFNSRLCSAGSSSTAKHTTQTTTVHKCIFSNTYYACTDCRHNANIDIAHGTYRK